MAYLLLSKYLTSHYLTLINMNYEYISEAINNYKDFN